MQQYFKRLINENLKSSPKFGRTNNDSKNFTEILRVIDSLQLTDSHKVATPVNWKQGEDVIIVPTLSNEEANPLFPKGYTEIKPYLRTTPCPL